MLVEAKYKRIDKPIDSRVLENFMKKVKNTKEAKIINLDFNYKDGIVEYVDYRKIF